MALPATSTTSTRTLTRSRSDPGSACGPPGDFGPHALPALNSRSFPLGTSGRTASTPDLAETVAWLTGQFCRDNIRTIDRIIGSQSMGVLTCSGVSDNHQAVGFCPHVRRGSVKGSMDRIANEFTRPTLHIV